MHRELAEESFESGRSINQLCADAIRDALRLRRARKAFARFRTSCFWSYDPDLKVEAGDIPWVAEQLKRYGGREAAEVGDQLCR